jgi:peptide chain release factor 2
MARPEFWNDQEAARRTIGEVRALKQVVEPLGQIAQAAEDLAVLADLASDDEAAAAEFERERLSLEQRLKEFEFRRMLSGATDANSAYLMVHSGAGGTESCDWTAMLMRMYVRWAEAHRYAVEEIESLPGEEAGLREVTLHIRGHYAYGYLKAEIGVHRLVRISPFDANKRRHTTFAAVDVTPEVDDDIEIEIKDTDLQVETYRSSGAGGQKVNKTSSAVRMTHLPTGIVVQCQNERSQHRNRATALKLLKARLYQIEESKRQAALHAAYDAKGEIAWGHQIRSYVLQPYQLVKDLRTEVETGNVQAVLDGDLDMFIEAYLKSQIQ